MKNIECYENKLEAAGAMAAVEVKCIHHVPAAVYIQEADFLYHWARNDALELAAVGVEGELIEDLPIRIGALIHAEAILRSGGSADYKKDRKRQARLRFAKDLRKRLLSDFRFAFRKHPPLLKALSKISKRSGQAGTIQGLNDLSVLGNNNRAQLESIHFDKSLLETAAHTAVEMAKIASSSPRLGQKADNAKRIRDRMYTHLKEAVDEIRQAGQYVYRENKERLSGYRSGFIRKLNRKQRGKREEVKGQPSKLKGAQKASGAKELTTAAALPTLPALRTEPTLLTLPTVPAEPTLRTEPTVVKKRKSRRKKKETPVKTLVRYQTMPVKTFYQAGFYYRPGPVTQVRV